MTATDDTLNVWTCEKGLRREQMTGLPGEPGHLSNAPEQGLSQGAEEVKLSLRQARLLSEIQVSLAVEVGEVSMSAAALIDLVAGQTFELELAADTKVKLRAGDEVIAEGRFISVDGRLALEILTVLEYPDAACGNREGDIGDNIYEDGMKRGGGGPFEGEQ